MKKWLVFGVVSALTACASEDRDELDAPDVHAQVAALDAAAATTAGDGGVGQAKAGEVGAACMADAECVAPGTKCLKEIALPFGDPITMPGGYCTKACTADAECGSGGAACPLAAAASFLPGVSQCLNPCKVASDCRAGYRCGASSLPSLGGAPATGSAAATYCLPPSPGLPAGGIPGGGIPGFPGN